MQIEAGTAPRQPPSEKPSTDTVQDAHGVPFHSNLRADLRRRLTLLHLRSPEAPPRPPTSHAHRKNHPAPPRTSASMQFATKRACCVVQATRTTWRGDGPSTLTAPTAARRGCPERACGTDTTLVQSPEHGLGVWCRAPGRVVPDVRMRPLPAPGAWQGGRGPNRGARFGWQRVTSGRHPNFRPGLIKGGLRSHPPSPSPLSHLLALHWLCLFATLTYSPLCSALSSLHLVVCLSLHLHLGLVCDRCSSRPVRSIHFHEPRQSDQARDNVLKVGSPKRSVPQSVLGCTVGQPRQVLRGR